MQGIILCGGLGTRLRSVIGEKQKTMTEKNGEPFLVKVIKYLKTYNITDIIFATGYKSEEIRNYFGNSYYFGVKVSYAEEKIPLGTGGAIRNCFNLIKRDEVVVVNGDTLFDANIFEMIKNKNKIRADMTIACKEVENKKRYGTVTIKSDVITNFNEKEDENVSEEATQEKFINGGVYLINKKLIETIPINQKISLEQELIPKWIEEGKVIGGIVCQSKFIDIGTPESLEEYREKWN